MKVTLLLCVCIVSQYFPTIKCSQRTHEDMLLELVSTVEKLQNRIGHIEHELSAVRETQFNLDRKRHKGVCGMTSHYAGFHVVRTTPTPEAPPETNIEFDQIETNYGGHWNTNAHQFVAPVKGLYVFHLVTKGHPSGTGGMSAIIVNSKILQKTQAQSNYAQSSASIVVELTANDQVYARLLEGGLWSNANNYLHFTGYLLYELE